MQKRVLVVLMCIFALSLSSLAESKKKKDWLSVTKCLIQIELIETISKNYQKALALAKEAKKCSKDLGDHWIVSRVIREETWVKELLKGKQ